MKVETSSDADPTSGISDTLLKPYFRFIFDRISDIVFLTDTEGKIREVNPSFEHLYGYTLEEIRGVPFENLIKSEELPAFLSLFAKLFESYDETLPFDLRLRGKDGEYRDLTGRMMNFSCDPAIGGILIIASDTTEQRRWETILGQYSHRLEVLQKIQAGILKAESPDTISRAALDHIHSIIPSPMASITLFDTEDHKIHLLAALGEIKNDNPTDPMEQIDEIQAVLKQGDWFEVEDVHLWANRSPLFQMLDFMGLKRLFFIPMLIRGNLIGSLNLAFLPDENVRLDHLEAAREIADMLALAIQQSRLLEAEQRQRQQAELIRDAISSIATSLNFQQIMADLLKNLRMLVSYDSARVVLIEEDALRVAAASGFKDGIEIIGKRYPKNSLIFKKMRDTELPVILSDINKEKYFTPWEGQKDLRSWMGLPLISHNGMIGYLSLNSSQKGAFDAVDLAPILVFADHVAVTLENAWLYDETVRRAKELAAIARVSTSLRKAKTIDELLNTLIEKTLEAIEARQGYIYRIHGDEMVLSAAVGPAVTHIGQRSLIKNDPLCEYLIQGRGISLGRSFDTLLLENWGNEKPFAGDPASTAFVPLVTTDGTVGLMCLNLEDSGEMDPDRHKILESIADMASNALYRVMMMGQLESRVADQTRDLTILYEVSSITSQALELKEMLSISLDRLLSFTTNSLGAVYQLDSGNSRLLRLVERRFMSAKPQGSAGNIFNLPEAISLTESAFFSEPLASGIPHLVPNLAIVDNLPPGFANPNLGGYIGIPIKSKGHALGMLCLFSKTPLNITIEQMTLLSAVGDQLGVAIESHRLRQRAAEAAVFEERQRLARDLHDSVTQSLYSLTLLAEGYRRQVPNGTLVEIQSWLEDLEDVSLQALKEMRLLLYELKPATFQEDGLMDALNRRLQSVESRSGMKVNFRIDPQTKVPPVYQEDLYRIAQEALNNTIKHSGADAIDIHLGNQEGRLLLEIHDNGKGFEPETAFNAGGLGLTGMTERARDLGGSLEIQSATDAGTTVRVLIPGGQK
jgi:PAS domain S-box-containing protein